MRRASLICVTLLGSCAGTHPSPITEQPSPAPASAPSAPSVADESPAQSSEPTTGEIMSAYSPTPSDAGTSAKCLGSAPLELRDELRMRALETKSCYETMLYEDPKLVGRMAVQLRIEGSGDVTTAAIEQDGVGNAGLRSCVVAVLARRLSSPPVGGCVNVLIPLNFRHKEADGGQESGP